MLPIMKTDKVANPIPVGFLRAAAVAASSNDCFNLILKAHWASCGTHQFFPLPMDVAYEQ
jgi:hypothetical protein